MAKNSVDTVEWQLEEELDIAEEAGPEDYVFVVRPDGGCKAILLPQKYDDSEEEIEMSEGIKKIMKCFESVYTETSAGHTIH